MIEHDLHADAELLDRLLNEAPVVLDRLTGKLVALTASCLRHWTGLSERTISAYRAGSLNIPVDFWRRILTHTLDCRIIALIMPPNTTFEVYASESASPRPAVDFLYELLAAEETYHAETVRLAETIAEGRLAEIDPASIRNLHAGYFVHRQHDRLLHDAIVTAPLHAKAKGGRRKDEG